MSTRVRKRRRGETPLQSKLAAQRVTGVTPEYSHVTAFPQPKDSNTVSVGLRKPPDLLECNGARPHDRAILTDPDKRLKKLAVETGWDTARNRRRSTPLEPWTCPVRMGDLMYANLMRDPDGAHNVAEFSGDGLIVLRWMREEQLASIGEDGAIHMLSDSRPPKGRAYPGAPCKDSCKKVNGAHTCAAQGWKCAGLGAQLRDHLKGLVRVALLNMSLGRSARPVRRLRSGLLRRSDGLTITAAQVAKEANAIKAKRRDLDGYRWVSLSRVREVIRELIAGGAVEEIEPPRAVRRERSWRTIPRVIRRMTADLSGLVPEKT